MNRAEAMTKAQYGKKGRAEYKSICAKHLIAMTGRLVRRGGSVQDYPPVCRKCKQEGEA